MKPNGHKSAPSRLVLASALALYLQVVLIRWVPGQVQVIAYFNNLVLIACFLGFGIGCATASRGPAPEKQALFRLLILAAICLAIARLGTIPTWLDAENFQTDARFGPVPSFAAAIIIFAAAALAQVPLGRMIGRAFAGLPPLTAYSLNLGGSIIGVSAMAGLRYFSIGPLWWFGIALGLFVPLFIAAELSPHRRAAAAAAVAVMAVVWLSQGRETWSPYYKVKIEDSFQIKFTHKTVGFPMEGAGYCITINDSFFQYALNLDPAFIKDFGNKQPAVARVLADSNGFYNLPYRLFKPKSVLILGAGSGNDTAAALINSVPQITAVEIDPDIARMGHNLHPQKPYNDPRVTLVIDDARHFLRTTPQTFDLIVYGLLDSHRLMAQMSTVRLEGFVYTRDALAEAAKRLNPGGAIVLTHASESKAPQQARLFQQLESVFPGRVHGIHLQDFLWFTIIAGPETIPQALDPAAGLLDVTSEYQAKPKLRQATDDWPFIYLTTDSFFATGYFRTLLIIVIVSLFILVRSIPELRRRLPARIRNNIIFKASEPDVETVIATDPPGVLLHFFLLGAGFLLLETKAVIDLSLIFGSTWMVNSIAIGAFLLMALLANLAVTLLKPQRTALFYLFLIAAIALNYALPVSHLLGSSLAARLANGAGMLALPVFFSGIIFAASLGRSAAPAVALGANVMGAVVGGFLEYSALFTGYRFLYLIAAAIYLISLPLAAPRSSTAENALRSPDIEPPGQPQSR